MVGTPSIVDVNVTDDRTASYTFEVTLYPEVTLGQYKGLEAERKDESVSDEDVDNELNSVRKRNARMIDIDDRAAEMGDTVDIDFWTVTLTVSVSTAARPRATLSSSAPILLFPALRIRLSA